MRIVIPSCLQIPEQITIHDGPIKGVPTVRYGTGVCIWGSLFMDPPMGLSQIKLPRDPRPDSPGHTHNIAGFRRKSPFRAD